MRRSEGAAPLAFDLRSARRAREIIIMIITITALLSLHEWLFPDARALASATACSTGRKGESNRWDDEIRDTSLITWRHYIVIASRDSGHWDLIGEVQEAAITALHDSARIGRKKRSARDCD